MPTPRLHDRRIIGWLEDAICTHELTLTLKLADGSDTTAEQAAIAELYRRLQVAHYFQAQGAGKPSR